MMIVILVEERNVKVEREKLQNKYDVENYGKLAFTEISDTDSVDYSEKNDFIRESQPILQDFIAPGGISASIDSSGHLVLEL